MNTKHAYDMLMRDLNAQIDQANTDRDDSTEKATKLQNKADADMQGQVVRRFVTLAAVRAAPVDFRSEEKNASACVHFSLFFNG